MADGKGCICAAFSKADCGCDADWTPQELIDARAEIARLRNQVEQLRDEVADAKKWAMSERGLRHDALVAADEARRASGSGESHE